jgi:tetratricopeptide (TPR) repeat protein
MSASNKTIQQLARAIKANPGGSFSKFALALEFRKRNELRRTRILFEDIYKNDPDYVGLYYHLGKLYEQLENRQKALKVYREGIEIAAKQKEARTEKELKEALVQLNVEMENQ